MEYKRHSSSCHSSKKVSNSLLLVTDIDEDDKYFMSFEILLSQYMSSYLILVNFISECQRFLDNREESGI